MCGIAGSFLDPDRQILLAMATTLRHRGPDDCGTWMNERVGFAATRLSLLDRVSGKQPMQSADHCIVFNGEIYNHHQLRCDLLQSGSRLDGRSDTEVILRGFQASKETFLDLLHGMYALAVTDGDALHLARDPFGMKPLFYWVAPDRSRLLFASEIKALFCSPWVPRHLDSEGLVEHATFGHTIGTRTLFSGISQVPPGARLRVTRDEAGHVVVEQIRACIIRAPTVPASLDEAANELLQLLKASVASHCEADHPIGAYLSGGVDSSIVAALMPRASNSRVHTFVISDRKDLEDVAVSQKIASYLGTEHHVVMLAPTDASDRLTDAVLAVEAPVGPNISRLSAAYVREHVKSVLCGEGADELFAGYRIHRDPGERVAQYLQSFSHFARAGQVDPRHLETTLSTLECVSAKTNPARQRALYEFLYRELLPNQHLVLWDRGSMAAGLEVRMPYLDVAIENFALSLPWKWLAKETEGKRILICVLRQLFPEEITNLIIRRNKLAAPSALAASHVHLRQFAASMMPSHHFMYHPFRFIFPRRLSLLLFDLFIYLFLARPGTLPDGFELRSLYTEHLRNLQEVLTGCAEEIFPQTGKRQSIAQPSPYTF